MALILEILIFATAALSWRWCSLAVPAVFLAYGAGVLAGHPWVTSVVLVIVFLVVSFRWVSNIPINGLSGLDWALLAFGFYISLNGFFRSNLYLYSSTLSITLISYFLFGFVFFVGARVGGLASLRPVCLGMVLLGGVYSLGASLAGVAEASDQAQLRVLIGDGSAVGMALPLPYVIISSLFVIFYSGGFFPNIWIRYGRLIALLCLCFALYFSVLNGTRSIFLAVAGGAVGWFAIMLLCNRISLRFYFLILAASFLVVVMWGLVEGLAADLPSLNRLINFDAYGSAEDASSEERYFRFSSAIQLFSENIFFGIGTSAYNTYTGLGYPHNIILEVACEGGVFGLLFFGFVVVSAMRSMLYLVRSIRHPFLNCSITDLDTRIVLCAYVAALLFAALAQQVVSYSLGNAKGMYLLFVLAGLQSAIRFRIQ